jgi:Ca2+-dependent lipid-binding protein
MVSQQAQEVNEAASALTDIARELEGSTARFKLTRSDRDGENVVSSAESREAAVLVAGPRLPKHSRAA